MCVWGSLCDDDCLSCVNNCVLEFNVGVGVMHGLGHVCGCVGLWVVNISQCV